MTSRLYVVVTVYVMCLSLALQLVEARPSVGIIRWDAWNQVQGQYDAVSECVEIALAPAKYQYRLPFYAKVSPTSISFNADVQAIMDQEILFAEHAGIDYWIFDTYCQYGPNCTTNSPFCHQYSQPGQTSEGYCPQKPTYGRDLYLNSKYVSKVNFTIMLLGSPACDPVMQESYISTLKNPHYQTVMGGRPLIYMFQFSDGEASACAGGWNESRVVFDAFRQKVKAAGLPNPYLVLMDFSVSVVQEHAQILGFDAVSTYALPGGDNDGTPMSQQIQAAQSWWQQAAATKFPFVPIAPTGWDPRPRYDHPCPCVNEGPSHFEQATAQEVVELISSALEFTCTNVDSVEAQTVVVYAWNESSENGAALIPSLGNHTMYVDALSKILPMECNTNSKVDAERQFHLHKEE